MAIPIKSKIQLDTTALSAGVARAKGKLAGLKSAALGVGAAFASMFAIAGIRSVLTQFDRVGKLAQRFGTSAETIQRLSFAAKLAGTDVESMAKAMTRARIAGQDAADGLTTMLRAFDDLNINVDEFNKLSPEDQLRAVEKGYIDAGKSGEAYAATLKILGTRAQEILPAFGGLGDSMDKATVASEDSVRKIQKINDAFVTLKNSWSAS